MLVALPFRDALWGDACILSFDTRLPGFAPFDSVAPQDVDARPRNLVTSDLNGWILPETSAFVRQVRAGRLPLWNPYVLCGQPLLANLAFAPFYPPNALAFVVEPLRALAWLTVLHFWLAGAFVFLFLRRGGVGAPCAFVGAVAAAFSSWLTVRLHLPATVMTAAWTFGLLLAVENLLRAPSAKRALMLSLAVGMTLLAGFPQLALLELLGAGAYAAVRMSATPRRARAAALGGAGVLLGVLLSAVSVLPSFATYRDSLRHAWVEPAAQAARGLSPAALAGLVLPEFFAAPGRARELQPPALEDHLPQRLWLKKDVQENPVENALWPGALALALAAAGLLEARRCAIARGLAVLVALGLLLAVANPLGAFLFEHVPGLAGGSPKRALVLFALPLAALSGIGLSALLRPEAHCARGLALVAAALVLFATITAWQARAWLGGEALAERLQGEATAAEAATWLEYLHATAGARVAAAAAALLLLGILPFLAARAASRARHLAAPAAALVLLLDLMPFAIGFNPLQEREGQYPRTPLVDTLIESGERSARFRDPQILPALLGPRYGYRSLGGGEPLVLRRLGEFLEAIEPGRFERADPRVASAFQRAESFGHPAFLRAATPWLLAREPIDGVPGVRLERAAYEEGLGLFRQERALPRVRLCAGHAIETDAARRLARLGDPALDPLRLVLLEDAPGEGHPEGAREPPAATAMLVLDEGDRLRIAIEGLATPALLVIADTYDAGWRGRVTLADGRTDDARVLPADHAFRAVPLPAGARELELVYRPRAFLGGAAASAAAAAGIVLALVAARLRRRRGHLNPPPAA